MQVNHPYSSGIIFNLKVHPIAVIAHDIRSAHNVGSIFRTADSAGFSHVYLTGYTATPKHRGVRKTALGAENSIPWSAHEDLSPLLADLKRQRITVAALERRDDAVSIKDVKAPAFPLALILGNEVDGVSEELLNEVDMVISLPQYGEKDSLNVSVAFGIAAYGLVEIFRAQSVLT
ncbi:MAG: TrmH family RNA methyltransferase [Rubricoccaceae bacterium]|nr:TrmH family RNA methyltransferase [Rubricoccaceae bacterium]